MGISLEEFLQGRDPCEICDAAGNQEHCITELLSREDSCILYNTMGRHQDRYTENDTIMLQELRENSDPAQVLDYYIRSSALVKHINGLKNAEEVWLEIYRWNIPPILHVLRSLDRPAALQAIMDLVANLEQRFAIPR